MMQSVEQVMTRSVLTVGLETPLSEVARLLVEHGISGLPVVDDAGRVVGVVSEGDLLIKEAGHPSPSSTRRAQAGHEARRQAKAHQSKIDARTAGEAMTSPALTIEPYRAVRKAAEIMTEHQVNRLPVVDADGSLLGIVTRADLIRAFVRSDEELAQAIRNDVIIRTMWLDPAKFTVSVDRGVARISAAVIKRSTAELIARFTAMVPGVLSVDSDITWTEDDGGVTVP
jgi:CBS domain-containing protein